MSTASKVTLAVTVVASLGVVYGVHSQQVEDRARLHDGIVRDEERQQRRREENRQQQLQQRVIEQQYRQAEKE